MRAVGRTGAPTALIMHAAPNIEPTPLLQLLPVHQLTQTPAQKYAPPSWQAAQEVAVLSHTLEDMDKCKRSERKIATPQSGKQGNSMPVCPHQLQVTPDMLARGSVYPPLSSIREVGGAVHGGKYGEV